MYALSLQEAQAVASIFQNLALLRLRNAVRTERLEGVLHFFSTIALVSAEASALTLEGFLCGPQIPSDIHFQITYDPSNGGAQILFHLHSGNPASDYDVVKKELVLMQSTVVKRVKDSKKKRSGGYTPAGYSLVPGTCGPKSLVNFTTAISSKLLTKNFRKFCRKFKFQLRRKK